PLRRLGGGTRRGQHQHREGSHDPLTMITELLDPKSSSRACGAAGARASLPSTRNEYAKRPGASGTSTIHVRPSEPRRSGSDVGFHALKSPTMDTLLAPGASMVKRTRGVATATEVRSAARVLAFITTAVAPAPIS